MKLLQAKSIVRRYLETHEFAKTLTPREDLLRTISHLRPVDTGYGLIRIGGETDGGYLLPDDLEGIAACFSPGTAAEFSFERMLATRYGIRSFMCDGSIASPNELPPLLHFEKLWLKAYTDFETETVSLNDWTRTAMCGGAGDLLLQIDIEGGEWEALLASDRDTLRRFRIITGEFHSMDLLANRCVKYLLMDQVLDRILQDFHCVHIHPNNFSTPTVVHGDIEIPPLLEITFHRKDRARSIKSIRGLPNPLDRRCVDGLPDIKLQTKWWEPVES